MVESLHKGSVPIYWHNIIWNLPLGIRPYHFFSAHLRKKRRRWPADSRGNHSTHPWWVHENQIYRPSYIWYIHLIPRIFCCSFPYQGRDQGCDQTSGPPSVTPIRLERFMQNISLPAPCLGGFFEGGKKACTLGTPQVPMKKWRFYIIPTRNMGNNLQPLKIEGCQGSHGRSMWRFVYVPFFFPGS